MYTFTVIEVRRGKPVSLISGTLDEIALKLLKTGKQQAAHDVATSTGRISTKDFRCIDTAPKESDRVHDNDGFYLTRNEDSSSPGAE